MEDLVGLYTMPVAREVKEFQHFDWWRGKGRPLGLPTSGQSSK